MRKRLITSPPPNARHLDEGWLDLDAIAAVEVTSEEKEYLVDSALISGDARGWRAADSGIQTIRLIFDNPQRLTRIALFSKRPKLSVPKSSFCDGPRMKDVRFGKLCVSSGISVRLRQHVRSRTIRRTLGCPHS
jgi:hypothetical protein